MKRRPKHFRYLPCPKPEDDAYRRFWAVVDGAVLDAFRCHPDYKAPNASMRTVRRSVTKRVTGAVLSFARQLAEGPEPTGLDETAPVHRTVSGATLSSLPPALGHAEASAGGVSGVARMQARP